MKNLYIVPILFVLLLVSSCSSDNDDDMGPPVKDVTYTATIKVIIDNNCLNCHVDPPVNGASMPLITFENVREAVMNRGLIGRVESGSMPPVGDVLTATEVQAIKDWQSGGFQE
jgi:hypothetical protein